MDMSFSFGDAVPLALPRLNYAELLAAIRDADGCAPPSVESDPLAPSVPAPAPAQAATLLAQVMLGRPEWRTASLMLRGRFADGSDFGCTADGARRKSV